MVIFQQSTNMENNFDFLWPYWAKLIYKDKR